MVAIWPGGLVGRVSGVDGATATIQTVFHPDSRVSAIDLRSRVLGIYRCLPGKGAVLDLVPLRSDIAPGDTLVSSGYGGVFPFGLRLGRVGRVEPDARRLQLRVGVEPALDLNRLSQTLIITGGQSPPLPSLAVPLPADTASQKPRLRQPALMRPALKIRPPQPRIVTPDTLKLELEGDR
jgi:rod shape-determining protein MreC